jgi:hypothetical protein
MYETEKNRTRSTDPRCVQAAEGAHNPALSWNMYSLEESPIPLCSFFRAPFNTLGIAIYRIFPHFGKAAPLRLTWCCLVLVIQIVPERDVVDRDLLAVLGRVNVSSSA